MKNLAVAFIIGLATAAIPLKEISNSYDYINGYVDPGFSYTFELAYETVYDSDVNSNDDTILYESYGLNVYSTLDLSFYVNVLDTYTYSADLGLTIFDITPYRQFIQWVNPVSVIQGSTFDIGLRAEYDIYFMEFVFEHTQTLKEFSYDLATWIEDFIAGTATFTDLIPTTSGWSDSDDVSFDSAIFATDPLTLGWDPTGIWYGNMPIYQVSYNGYITANA